MKAHANTRSLTLVYETCRPWVPGKTGHIRKSRDNGGMQSLPVFRRLVTAVFLAVCLSVWVSSAVAQAPSTVIHIVNVKWKEDASPEQIQAVIDAVRQLPSKYPGLKRIWTKDIKYQGQEGYKQAIVMEFESQDALKKYEDSPAQQWWYKIYLPVRDESRTHDVTN
jgi:hypothetical protein